ncbi:transmembrane protein 121B-like [Argiope bruennichi]|uniref:transmembrane protein 121B-like n=1 Tax=Argiope bruennichi TaxID=94029 RepID=UPI002494E322|nr:transmembrane protein 121B-like [Argiope bruennichi]
MTQTESPCSCTIRLVLHVLDCLGLLLIIVLQGSILDYYLILHNGGNAAWYFWFLADFLILIAFMAAAVISYRYYQKKGRERKTESSAKESSSDVKSFLRLGSLPLVYTVWFFYSSLLTAKVVLLFKLDVAQSLDADSAFGPQLLKVIIASSAVVFLLLVETHNHAELHSDHQAYIYYLITSTVFEIFDSVTFLGILFPTQSRIVLTYPLENSVLLLSCINFILPTMTLYKLSLSEFGKKPRSLGLQLLYKWLHLCLVNIPYFVIRVYLWSLYDHDVTLFLLKNILAVIVTARTAVPEIKLLWHSMQESRGKRRKFFSNVMELGAVYEITDNHGDEGNLRGDEKKVLHSTEL